MGPESEVNVVLELLVLHDGIVLTVVLRVVVVVVVESGAQAADGTTTDDGVTIVVVVVGAGTTIGAMYDGVITVSRRTTISSAMAGNMVATKPAISDKLSDVFREFIDNTSPLSIFF